MLSSRSSPRQVQDPLRWDVQSSDFFWIAYHVKIFAVNHCYVVRQFFSTIVSSQKMWNVPPFSTALPKTTQTRPQDFSVTLPFSGLYLVVLKSIYRISQTSSKFGQQKLAMDNYPGNLSKTEKEKYFEWIITSEQNYFP